MKWQCIRSKQRFPSPISMVFLGWVRFFSLDPGGKEICGSDPQPTFRHFVTQMENNCWNKLLRFYGCLIPQEI